MRANVEASLRIRLLGRFVALVDGGEVPGERWPRRKSRQLLQLLAIDPGRRLHQEQVMEALWPKVAPSAAANSLNKAIHMTRRALEPELKAGNDSRFIRRSSQQITLAAPGGLSIDVEEFDRQATAALRQDDARACEAALALYRGDLLMDDPYEEWSLSKRGELQALYHDLLLKVAEIYRLEGRDRASIGRLSELTSRDPSNEEAHRRLMEIYASTGRRELAVRQYGRCREALRDLGIEPDKATKDLHAEIATGRHSQPRIVSAPAANRVDSIESLAVMPLINTTSSPNLEYLCEGIAEGVINTLSHVPRLRVMALSTVDRFRSDEIDPQSVGRELAVEAVFLGRVMYWSDKLIVRAELVRVSDGSLLWGEQYARELADILDVQASISNEISETLKLELDESARQRLSRRHTESTRAFHYYLKGRHAWNRRTVEGLQQGIFHFQHAIDEDPTYALAYSGLADCHNLLSLYGDAHPREAMSRAKFAAERALEIDDSLAEAHTSLAYNRLYYDWDWAAAESSFKRALALNPNYATAHHWYHEFLAAMGRFDEQAAAIRRAEKLDPLSLIIKTEFGWGHYFAGHYDRAIRHLNETLERNADFVVARFILGLVHLQKGSFDEACGALETAISLSRERPFTLAIGSLGHAHARAGREDEARRQLRTLTDLSTQGYVSAYTSALIHVGLGDNDAALEQLHDALDDRCDRLIFLQVEPMFDGLRQEPGFRELLRKVGLPKH